MIINNNKSRVTKNINNSRRNHSTLLIFIKTIYIDIYNIDSICLYNRVNVPLLFLFNVNTFMIKTSLVMLNWW